MSKTTKTETPAEQPTAWPFDYGGVLATDSTRMKTVVEANRTLLDGMTALSEEMGRFVDRRLKEDFKATQSLMRCGSPEEAFQVQFAFAQTATQQYFEAAARLTALALDIACKNCAPMDVATAEAPEKAAPSE